MRYILLFTLLGVVVTNATAALEGEQPPVDQCIGSNLRSCCMKTLQGKDSADEVCKLHNCADDACDDFKKSGSGWNSWSKPTRKVS